MPTLMANPLSMTRSRQPASSAGPARTGPHELARLLPAKGDPDYLWILCEMVRADLEMNWTEGRQRRLGDYKKDFPELFQDAPVLRAIACEEYQIRESFGDNPDPNEYAHSYGVIPVDRIRRANVLTDTVAGKVNVVRETPDEMPGANDYLLPPDVAGGINISPAHSAKFPAIGETFLGFRLTEELGRGAFARVYLARQVALADRAVALKVTTRPTQEPDRLAKLQHTNIVPIFSVHSAGMLQAVCMPYLGRATLADTINAMRKNGISPQTGSELFSTVMDAATVPEHPVDSPTPPVGIPSPIFDAEASPQPVRDMLSRMSYLDAVAWVVARLAEGLTHAHRRGIRHYDLKPANVLLGDDGQPMLLDFNLAHDVAAGKREQLGGTIMYMAPEQLEEVRDQSPGRVTEQTDLYSLGVIFFELLTGRHPFALSGQANKVGAALELRKAGAPPVRSINPAVSPAIEAVVQRLLEPDPTKRYASAEYLWTDLDRHAIHLPLLYTDEPSIRESFRKWRYRNPGVFRRVGFAVAALTVAVSGAWAYTAHQASRVAAADDVVRRYRNDLETLRVDLTSPLNSPSHASGVAKATEWLAIFGVSEAGTTGWAKHPVLTRLNPTDRAAFAADLGETAALLGFAQRPEDVPAGEKDDAKARAGKWFAAAVECFRGQPVPAAIRDSQATLAGSQPEPDLIVDDESSRATFLRGVAQFVSGRYPAAVQQFEAVTRAHADHYGAQFLLGRCHFELGEHARAQERFDMARALAANDYRPAYNRGLSLLQIGRNADAEEEFTAVIVQNPTYAPAYFERAMARQLSKPKDALADLARAADLGGETAPLLNVRVRVYTELHNEPAAEAARQAILKFHAKTAIDYTILGYTLQNKKRWAEALEAYRKASDLNPTDFISWYNQATVIEKSHGKSEDMIVVLNKAVTASPKSSLALVGRGLTYARLGNREEAIKDVEKGLQMTEHLIPTTIYHAACAYALTSQIEPNDADRAVNLLRWAAKAGFHRWDIMESDTDLEAVQNRDDYKRIIESIKELVK